MRKRVLVLGSTGSIGCSTLDVIARHRDRFDVVGLVAHRNADALFEQVGQFAPAFIALLDPETHRQHAARFTGRHVDSTLEAVCRFCEDAAVDIVVASIVGAAGMAPTLAAVRAGKTVLLANKESLVLTGALMMDAASQSGARILPVDSEHNAIFQSLPADFDRRDPTASGVTDIWLTASGGPFRDTPLEQLVAVTPEQAVAHPNWSMGRKISVDSATMANKGLELIEAHWLFGLPSESLRVLVHPQSIVHSLVQYRDGSFLAQLGSPDMRTPIAHCLAYPGRIDAGVKPLNLADIGQLQFRQPDLQRFRPLHLARQALEAGGTGPAVFNAANEVAVDAFLSGQIGFLDIPACIEHALQSESLLPASSLPVVLEADAGARRSARQFCQQKQ